MGFLDFCTLALRLSPVVFSIFKFRAHTGAHERPAYDKLFQAMSRRL